MTEEFVTALLGAPFGLKGFIRIQSLSGEYAHLEALKDLRLRQQGKEKSYAVEEFRKDGAGLLLKLQGVDSPEAAKLLKGAEILVDRKNGAALDEGEYYIEDLKGLLVVDEGGRSRGTIRDVVEGGGAMLVELETETGLKRFIPFRNEFLGDIDWEKGQIPLLKPWVLE